ncbi:hypothetical protein KIN20_022916 [Parelaphostrongylus tenuis]|uniref:Uncharacterized protein n=1 Tax=Parelaphostrongylus tenuis TaxID=148309 RepID=A0AAD5NBV9_PARTN|nr:hypothetical protein KIN20_022916 [Parelaphostrongylus tenuis]
MSVRQSIQKTENEEKPSDKKDSQGQSEVASADVKESQETKESKSPTNKESQVDNKESQFKESNVKSPKESRDQTKVKSSGEKESIEQTAVAEVTGFSLILHVMIKWKTPLLLILPPLLMSPLVLSEKKELRCAFCVCLMGVYWMTEALPLAVTALIPIVLYPLTQVMTCKAVAQQFINDTNFLYVGGLIVAIAIEKCFLHKRIALFVLNKVGERYKILDLFWYWDMLYQWDSYIVLG